MKTQNKAMKQYLESRIHYLRTQENIALILLDCLSAGTVERLGKWELIKALTERRRELEEALNFLVNSK